MSSYVNYERLKPFLESLKGNALISKEETKTWENYIKQDAIYDTVDRIQKEIKEGLIKELPASLWLIPTTLKGRFHIECSHCGQCVEAEAQSTPNFDFKSHAAAWIDFHVTSEGVAEELCGGCHTWSIGKGKRFCPECGGYMEE